MLVSEDLDWKFLSIFADAKPHSFFEVVYLGTIYLNVHQKYTERLLHRAVVDNNWIYRLGVTTFLQQDQLMLTVKGDSYYRSMAIRRNPEDYRLYKYFNREQESQGFSSFGMDKIAPLSEGIRATPNGFQKGSQ